MSHKVPTNDIENPIISNGKLVYFMMSLHAIYESDRFKIVKIVKGKIYMNADIGTFDGFVAVEHLISRDAIITLEVHHYFNKQEVIPEWKC